MKKPEVTFGGPPARTAPPLDSSAVALAMREDSSIALQKALDEKVEGRLVGRQLSTHERFGRIEGIEKQLMVIKRKRKIMMKRDCSSFLLNKQKASFNVMTFVCLYFM